MNSKQRERMEKIFAIIAIGSLIIASLSSLLTLIQ